MAVLYVVQESHYVLRLYIIIILFSQTLFSEENGLHSYFRTISGLGVI